MTVVEKNEGSIAFAEKTEDPSAIVTASCLEAVEEMEPRISIRSEISSLLALSKRSSQCNHDYLNAKMEEEEIENKLKLPPKSLI